MKFPHPKNSRQYFIFKDKNFVNVFNENEKYKVLVYSENFDGWNDNLTKMKEAIEINNHPIDTSSVKLCQYILDTYVNKKDNIILEIGCLNGELTRKIIENKRYQYIGSDASQINVFKLAEKFKDTPFIVFDITQNPFKNNICDVLIMLNVLEHINDDDLALNQAYKLLNHKGTLIIEVPAGKILYDDYDKELLHFRRYNSKEIIKKLLNAGFLIEKITHLGFFTYPIFFLIKLFNKFFKIKNIVENETKISNNLLIKFLFYIELKLFKLNLPFGIRTVICAKKN